MPPFLKMEKLQEHLRTLKDFAKNKEVCAALDDLTAILLRRGPLPPKVGFQCQLKSIIVIEVTSSDLDALLSKLADAELTNDKLQDAVKRVRKELKRK
jgi:hypothetical protein